MTDELQGEPYAFDSKLCTVAETAALHHSKAHIYILLCMQLHPVQGQTVAACVEAQGLLFGSAKQPRQGLCSNVEHFMYTLVYKVL